MKNTKLIDFIRAFRILVLVFAGVLVFYNCKSGTISEEKNAENDISVLKINLEPEYQLIHGFGASDAWSCQFIGKIGRMKKRIKWPIYFSV